MKSHALLEVSKIRPNPFQARQHFAEEKIAELAASIKEVGLLHPIIAREKNGHFELASGEMRLRAAKRLRWAKVPVEIRVLNDEQMAIINLSENLQRGDLTDLEKADGIAL